MSLADIIITPQKPVSVLGQVQKCLNKISGPLLDRIDIQIEIVPVPFEEMANNHPAEPSSEIRKRVIKARQIQDTRFADQPGIYCNAQMTSKLLAQYAQPDNKGLTLLKNAMNRLNLSARAYDRILKVSHIADLEGSEQILSAHLAEEQLSEWTGENWEGEEGNSPTLHLSFSILIRIHRYASFSVQ